LKASVNSIIQCICYTKLWTNEPFVKNLPQILRTCFSMSKRISPLKAITCAGSIIYHLSRLKGEAVKDFWTIQICNLIALWISSTRFLNHRHLGPLHIWERKVKTSWISCRSHEPFETARTGHVSAGEHVLGTLRSAKQATESVPGGWGAGGLVLLWPWMGRQPLPRYLQGRTCRCGSSTCICIASALDPTDPLNRIYQGAQCSAAHTLHPSANYQWLPAAAACFSAVGSPHVGFTRLSMRRTGRAGLLCNRRQ